MKRHMMTADEILQQLDECADAYTFPMLDNGYVYPADTRMSIFRDEANWLMILEALGTYTPRVSGLDSFQNCLHLFGSDLHRRPGTANEDFLCPIASCPDAPFFENEYEWFARNDVNCVLVRGNRIRLDLSQEALDRKGISLLESPRIDPVAILRSLLPEHRDLLFASAVDLEERNPHRLPLWMRLEEWHHPDLAGGEKPSESLTFRMLAEAISFGDAVRYHPSMPPNTHWSNWTEGGTL